jgi:hypothetical protein
MHTRFVKRFLTLPFLLAHVILIKIFCNWQPGLLVSYNLRLNLFNLIRRDSASSSTPNLFISSSWEESSELESLEEAATSFQLHIDYSTRILHKFMELKQQDLGTFHLGCGLLQRCKQITFFGKSTDFDERTHFFYEIKNPFLTIKNQHGCVWLVRVVVF